METLKINIPEGYEIDTDNTDLATGEISLRPKKKQLPKTWDEFCEQNHKIKPGESFISQSSGIKTYEDYDIVRDNVLFKNVLPDKETAESMLALCQLIQLRNCYNGVWKPDWNTSSEKKYIIYIDRNDITVGTNVTANQILSFKTSMLRDEFLCNFRNLIEIAKPLL